MSSCLQNIEYEEDCDKEIAEIKELLKPDSFIESFANSVLKVTVNLKAEVLPLLCDIGIYICTWILVAKREEPC